MKVLMLNGSCNPKGCTYTALTEVGKTLTSAGIDYEIVQLGGDPVRDCIGCNQCSKNGCVFTDGGVNDFIAKARQAGKRRVVLTCKEKLIHYYERFGFSNCGVSQSVHGGAVWYDMECILA